MHAFEAPAPCSDRQRRVRPLRLRPHAGDLDGEARAGRFRDLRRVGRAPEEAREFLLRELPPPAELAREAGADTHIFAYRIDDADLPRLAAFRAELIARKSSGQRGSITISVQPQACKAAELPDGPVYLTTYLRTAETDSYVTLARDVDLRTLPAADAIVEKIPRCAP